MRVSIATLAHPVRDHIGPLERAQTDVTVLRRATDVAELIAIARSGTVDALLVAWDTEHLTATLLAEIDAASRPVGVAALSDVAGERARLRRLGVPVLRAGVDPLDLASMMKQAARDAHQGRPRLPLADAGDADAAAQTAAWNAALDAGSDRHGDDLERLDADDAEAGEARTERDGHDHSSPQARFEHEQTADWPSWDASRVEGWAADGRSGTASDDDGEVQETDAADDVGEDAAAAAPPQPHEENRERPGSSEPPSQDGAQTTDEPGPTAAPTPAPTPGTVTVVWGPAGAPGRSTLAVNLAAEHALAGRSTVVIDADTTAPSLGVLLGLTEESAGLAQATRAADRAELTGVALREAAVTVRVAGARLDVLTGITRPERWPEIRSEALREVLSAARWAWDEVVIDVASSLEQDEELSFDIPAPQRHAATLTAVAAADRLIAVGTGDSVGLPRLMRGVLELDAHVSATVTVETVVNRIRSASSGLAPQSQISAAWTRFSSAPAPAAFLPHDPQATDRALLSGQMLAEAAPSSGLRKAIRSLALREQATTATPRSRALPRPRWARRLSLVPVTLRSRRSARAGAQAGGAGSSGERD
ncbi:MAG: ATPase [Micrococcus sp.]|nr:ATPase [Micrococcus sp.]